MRSIDDSSAEAYLRETGRIRPEERVRVRELTGGVSNMVLLIERPDGPADRDIVLKQARAQLRTRQAWFSSVERIWREAEVLALCGRLLEHVADARTPRVGVPRIVFEDRDNYLFAMTAAPRPNTTWKEQLLTGQADAGIAEACGRLLATLHGTSWLDPQVRGALADRTLFEQLRVDPYYRTLALARPEVAGAMESVERSLAEHCSALVLGDFSPKNLLVSAGCLTIVDFETGHYGDPAFDLGFFLSHLVLKACRAIPRHAACLRLSESFWRAYDEALRPRISAREMEALKGRAVRNFAGCAWARLDGKSPVEYLTDETRREKVRAICREVLAIEPVDWPPVIALCERRFGEN